MTTATDTREDVFARRARKARADRIADTLLALGNPPLPSLIIMFTDHEWQMLACAAGVDPALYVERDVDGALEAKPAQRRFAAWETYVHAFAARRMRALRARTTGEDPFDGI